MGILFLHFYFLLHLPLVEQRTARTYKNKKTDSRPFNATGELCETFPIAAMKLKIVSAAARATTSLRGCDGNNGYMCEFSTLSLSAESLDWPINKEQTAG
jgi:hypothetical protein